MIRRIMITLCISGLAACGADSDDESNTDVDASSDAMDGDADTTSEWTADGTWTGDWTSDREFGGTTTITMQQDGQVLSGTIVLAGAPCISEVRFEGALDPANNSFTINLIDDDDPTKDYVIAGFLYEEQNFMDATYTIGNWGVCSDSEGTLTATRQ